MREGYIRCHFWKALLNAPLWHVHGCLVTLVNTSFWKQQPTQFHFNYFHLLKISRVSPNMALHNEKSLICSKYYGLHLSPSLITRGRLKQAEIDFPAILIICSKLTIARVFWGYYNHRHFMKHAPTESIGYFPSHHQMRIHFLVSSRDLLHMSG